MKMPTAKGWIAILGALAALVIAGIAAFKDGNLTKDEAADLKDKTGVLIEEVQQATTGDTP